MRAHAGSHCFRPQARSVAAAMAHWRDRRGVQMDITAMPGYQELSAPVRRLQVNDSG